MYFSFHFFDNVFKLKKIRYSKVIRPILFKNYFINNCPVRLDILCRSWFIIPTVLEQDSVLGIVILNFQVVVNNRIG